MCNANGHRLRFCIHTPAPQEKKSFYSQHAFDFISLSCTVTFLSLKAYQQTSDRLSASVHCKKITDIW